MIWRGGRYLCGRVHWCTKAAPPLEHACWGRWSILALPDDATKVMSGRTPLEMVGACSSMGAVGSLGACGSMGAVGLMGALDSMGAISSM